MKAQANRSRLRLLLAAWIVTAAVATSSVGAYAQTAAAAGPRAVGAGMLHLNVTNIEQSLTLYRDVMGLEVVTPPGQPRAAGALVSEPGALLKTVVLGVPGGTFRLELVEWTGTPLKPQQQRIQDPGAVMLAMRVRDIDATLGGVRTLGLRVLTSGGAPVVGQDSGGPRKTVMVRDWDGFVVEFVQGGRPVSGVTMYVSVQDLAQTVAFYNRVFGFDMPMPAAAQPAPDRIKAYFGDSSLATMRSARGTFPGSEITLNFQEFGAPDRKPVRHRVQDPGGPILPVTVQDFPAVIEQVRANGGIIGVGDASVALPPDVRSSWIRDPNGVLIQVSLPRQRN
jgi:catechol 2,3-dioxygenase-like lactoylglutathione lyase family enzyme